MLPVGLLILGGVVSVQTALPFGRSMRIAVWSFGVGLLISGGLFAIGFLLMLVADGLG
jgi:hypothetical protein